MLMKVCFVYAIIGCTLGAWSPVPLEPPKATVTCFTSDESGWKANCTACNIKYFPKENKTEQNCIKTTNFPEGEKYDYQTGNASKNCTGHYCNMLIKTSCLSSSGKPCEQHDGYNACFVRELANGTLQHGCTIAEKFGFACNQFTCDINGPRYCNSIDAYQEAKKKSQGPSCPAPETVKPNVTCYLDGWNDWLQKNKDKDCTACNIKYFPKEKKTEQNCIKTTNFLEGEIYDYQTGKASKTCTEDRCNFKIYTSCLKSFGACHWLHGFNACFVKELPNGTFQHGCTNVDEFGFKDNQFTCDIDIRHRYCNSIDAYQEAKKKSQGIGAGK